jgi:hypothetical protein
MAIFVAMRFVAHNSVTKGPNLNELNTESSFLHGLSNYNIVLYDVSNPKKFSKETLF